MKSEYAAQIVSVGIVTTLLTLLEVVTILTLMRKDVTNAVNSLLPPPPRNGTVLRVCLDTLGARITNVVEKNNKSAVILGVLVVCLPLFLTIPTFLLNRTGVLTHGRSIVVSVATVLSGVVLFHILFYFVAKDYQYTTVDMLKEPIRSEYRKCVISEEQHHNSKENGSSIETRQPDGGKA